MDERVIAAYLRRLEVTRPQVVNVYANGQPGPPFDHLALIVRPADGSGPWLADVGFGSHSVFPLLLDHWDGQDDPAGRFLLADSEDGDVDVLRNGEPQYRIERRERSLADFVPTCWWQQTSPQSHFTRDTICSRLTADGRISISGRTLIRTSGASRAEQQLSDDPALLTAYGDHFGIVLDRVPRRGVRVDQAVPRRGLSAAHSWSRMDISTSSYQRPSCSTDSRSRPSSTNPAFS